MCLLSILPLVCSVRTSEVEFSTDLFIHDLGKGYELSWTDT